MEHIERMEHELEELIERKRKAVEFYEEEMKEHKFTDEIQRVYLALQIRYMEHYIEVLTDRIEYDKQKYNKPCSTSEN